jgi:hypothetical protein
MCKACVERTLLSAAVDFDLASRPNSAPLLKFILISSFARVGRTLLSVAFDFAFDFDLDLDLDFDFDLDFDLDFASELNPRTRSHLLTQQDFPPRNTNGADQKACAAVFLTLYI